MAPLSQMRAYKQPTEPAELIDLAEWWDSPTRRKPTTTSPRTWLRQTKFALPALGLLLLTIAFIWPAFLPPLPSIKATLEKLSPGVTEELAMFDLTYQGTNKNGSPFGVEAIKAVRADTTADNATNPEITLTTPRADLVTKDGNFVAVHSDTGVYNEEAQALQMEGNVEIFHDNGATFNAPFLDVDFNTNTARTTRPVSVHGDFGTINAPGMVLEDGGDKVIFTGSSEARARAIIKGAPQGGLTPTGADAPKAPPTIP